MSEHTEVIQPAGWAPARGYANGVLAEGRVLHIGGQIGWDGQQNFVADDFVGQAEQALANVVEVLHAAGGEARHVTRLTWYMVDMEEYRQSLRELGGIYRRFFGSWYPAMSAVGVTTLVEKRARVEIEATAVLPLRGQSSSG